MLFLLSKSNTLIEMAFALVKHSYRLRHVVIRYGKTTRMNNLELIEPPVLQK